MYVVVNSETKELLMTQRGKAMAFSTEEEASDAVGVLKSADGEVKIKASKLAVLPLTALTQEEVEKERDSLFLGEKLKELQLPNYVSEESGDIEKAALAIRITYKLPVVGKTTWGVPVLEIQNVVMDAVGFPVEASKLLTKITAKYFTQRVQDLLTADNVYDYIQGLEEGKIYNPIHLEEGDEIKHKLSKTYYTEDNGEKLYDVIFVMPLNEEWYTKTMCKHGYSKETNRSEIFIYLQVESEPYRENPETTVIYYTLLPLPL